jgi:archaellum component FlaF (FlaF/FlaG flagellin family)
VGFGTVASYMVFFFAVILLVGSMVTIYSSMVDSSNLAYAFQQERVQQLTQTIIQIDGVAYVPGELHVNATSRGSNRLRTEFLDLYVDGMRIPRSELNRTIQFAAGSTAVNPLLWDPYETLEITIYINLDPGDHSCAVKSEHGLGAERAFAA